MLDKIKKFVIGTNYAGEPAVTPKALIVLAALAGFILSLGVGLTTGLAGFLVTLGIVLIVFTVIVTIVSHG